MRTALILVAALVTVVNGDITGSNPRNGACLCFSDNSVNIRSSACGQRIIGSASSGQCFKYAGSNNRCSLNNRNYHFFQINYKGNQGWSAGVYLDLASDSRCGSSGGGSVANGNEYKCEVADKGRRIHESSSRTQYDCRDSSCQNTCRGGQCVAYVKCRCKRNGKYPPSTGSWRPGQNLLANGKCNRNIAPNTAIATFPSNGKYYGHAAVFIQCISDSQVQVYDQWCGRSVGYSTYSLSNSRYSSFATITSSGDGPASLSCRSETSGSRDCKATAPGCSK